MTVPRSMLAEKLSALLSGDDMREVAPSAIRNFVKQNRDALMEAVTAYAEGKQSDVSRPAWISVKDRLPPEFEDVLLDHIIDDNEHVIDIAWQNGGKWSFPWISRLAKEDCAPVWPVCWMPLPEMRRANSARDT